MSTRSVPMTPADTDFVYVCARVSAFDQKTPANCYKNKLSLSQCIVCSIRDRSRKIWFRGLIYKMARTKCIRFYALHFGAVCPGCWFFTRSSFFVFLLQNKHCFCSCSFRPIWIRNELHRKLNYKKCMPKKNTKKKKSAKHIVSTLKCELFSAAQPIGFGQSLLFVKCKCCFCFCGKEIM